jgi:hypothetical protein
MPEFVEGVVGAAFVAAEASAAGAGAAAGAAAAGALVSVAGVALVSLLGLLQPVSAGRERAMRQRGRRDFMEEEGLGLRSGLARASGGVGSTMTASGGIRKYFIRKNHWVFLVILRRYLPQSGAVTPEIVRGAYGSISRGLRTCSNPSTTAARR